jgi:hypothetical protein
MIQNLLKITELNDSGAVPQLKVMNNAELPVLILDGEELMGAKQNRIVNTSILLREKFETIIPEDGHIPQKISKIRIKLHPLI